MVSSCCKCYFEANLFLTRSRDLFLALTDRSRYSPLPVLNVNPSQGDRSTFQRQTIGPKTIRIATN